MKTPTSSTGKAKFRGPSSSSEHNQEESQKYADLVELFKAEYENGIRLKESNTCLLESNIALQRYIRALENRLTATEMQLEAVTDNSTWYTGLYSRIGLVEDMRDTFPSAIDENGNTQQRCEISEEYRHATIPIVHQISKTHTRALDGSYIIPTDLIVNVSRTSTDGTVTDTRLLNMFDGEDESYWMREVSYPINNPIAKEDAIIEVELPLRIVNDLNINTIQVNPYPEKGVKIANVEVYHNNGWQQIPGFEQQELTTIKDNSPRRKWCFPNMQITKVRITLEQSFYNERSGKKIFALGLQELGVYLSTYDVKGGIVLVPFDLSNVGSYRIEGIDPIFLNRSTFSYPASSEDMLLGSIYNYELYEENADKTLMPIHEAVPLTAKKVWVKVTLRPDPEPSSSVNPCLTAVRLNFIKD